MSGNLKHRKRTVRREGSGKRRHFPTLRFKEVPGKVTKALLPQPKPVDTSSEDADIILFLSALWTHRRLISGTAATFAILGLVLALVLPPQYRGRTTFLFAESDSASSAASQLASRFGSLASLAGISVGGQSGQSARALALLKSNRFAVEFIRKNGLDRQLFPKRWNTAARRWRSGLAPSDSELSEKWFRHVFSLSEDQKSGQISVGIVWPGDAGTAAQLANQFVKEADEWLRNDAIDRTEEHLAFLSRQLAANPTQGTREAITQLMESEIERRMFANSTGHYLIEVIDPAIPEHKAVFPSLPIFVIGFGLLGSMMASIAALVRTYILLRRAANANVVAVRPGIAKSA